MDDDRMLVTMEMEDGEEIEFEVYSIFEVEGLEGEYAALIRAGEAVIEQFYLFKVNCIEESEDGEDLTYEILNIDDDEEYEEVEEAFNELLDSEEWNRLYSEDEDEEYNEDEEDDLYE